MDQRAKILIVDDEPFNIDCLEQELQYLGYDSVSAANGRAALRRVEVEAPDLILLDIVMPEMDGFEVLSRLKANERTRDIPVIVISVLDDMGSVVECIERGAEEYLPKPFEPVLLHARIHASLERKRLRDQEQLYLRGLERELEIGRQIQAEFLPSGLPQLPGWEIAAFIQAAREVAGDFYDAFTLSQDGEIGLVVGDVSDKGVGAALYMTLFRTLLRAVTGLDELTSRLEGSTVTVGGPINDYDEILKNAIALTNQYVAENHGQSNVFASIFFAVLDQVTGSMHYINGGHEPPIIYGPGGVKNVLMPTGPVVGVLPEADFTVGDARLEPDDTLLVFTDGVTEAQNSDGDMFGEERLLGLLAPPTETAQALLDRVTFALREHTGQAEQFDDITMLAVRRKQ
jgi:sigma-B regulation protein RsbU (phosphoserine phosphatase)